jgi:phage head maturation protease
VTLEHKASSATPESGLIASDDATGVVEAIVSVTGVVDEDRDVIEPGAYAKSLTRRRPKGIFAHDWGRWVARTEHIEELAPGDNRLPKVTKDGKPWPPQAGGLYVRSRFNLETSEGSDAYKNVKFFSEGGECDWSIGFRVPQGASQRNKTTGHRHIKEVDLYEYSPVLFGAAGKYSGTLSVKALDAPAEPEPEDAETGPEAAEPDEPQGSAAAPDGEGEPGTADGDPEQDTAVQDPGEAEEPGDGATEDTSAAEDDELDDLDEDDVALLEDLDPESPGPEEEGEEDAPAEGGQEDTPGEPGQDKAEEGGEEKRQFSGGKRRQLAKQGTALPDGSYPIVTIGDLRNAIKAFGRAKPGDRGKVKAHIVKRARALGRTDLLPDNWKAGSGKKDDGTDVQDKGSSATLNRSPRKNWVENTGELPPYVREIARSIHNKRGIPLSQAIPIAIAQIKKWARGGDDVNADTRAKATKALAQWEKLKARNAARRKSSTYDPTLEVGPDAGSQRPQVIESTLYPFLPGTAEELREKLTAAAVKTLDASDGRVQVAGTWPDRVVVTCYAADVGGGAQSYEIPYVLKSGEPLLGDAEPVQLTIFDIEDTPDGQGGEGELLSPYPGMVEQVTEEVKALVAGRGLEDKAGKVLSNANAKRLKAAVEQLVTVLRAAGVDISPGPEEQEQPQTRPELNDSTAPSARTPDTGVKTLTLDPGLHARAWRLIADARTP